MANFRRVLSGVGISALTVGALLLLLTTGSTVASAAKKENKEKKAKAEPELVQEAPAAAEADEAQREAELAALPPEIRKQVEAINKFQAETKPQEGTIQVADGKAKLALPANWAYLNPSDTDRLLQLWGNPPDPTTLGLFFDKETGLFGESIWAVIVTYSDDGHIEDDDAKDINFDELLESMKESSKAENEERVRLGLTEMSLVGWAEPPHYDSANRKLYWAKEFSVPGADTNSLNYSIRVLGRTGVLELNAVSDMTQLPKIRTGMNDVLGFVSFNEGHRYADFNPSMDKVAAYGIGALIAGKVIAKAGLFKGLLALLLASKKLLVIGVIAIGAGLKKLFSRKSAEAPATVASAPPPPTDTPEEPRA